MEGEASAAVQRKVAGADVSKRLKFIDLARAIENDIPSDPPDMIPVIEYLDHAKGADRMAQVFGLKDAQTELPGGLGWAVEYVRLSTHSGSHLDAPYHYHPTMEGGERAWTIDEVPLDYCFAPGVCLDFSHMPDGAAIGIDDLESALDRIGHRLAPREIVLIRTGADEKWGTPEYLFAGAGMTAEGTLWLVEQGVRIMGTDAWSWDVPLPHQAKRYQETGDASIIWQAHFSSIKRWHCHMEKLTNLHLLPPDGFTVCCFPVKIRGASAGWVRPVAIVEEDEPGSR